MVSHIENSKNDYLEHLVRMSYVLLSNITVIIFAVFDVLNNAGSPLTG